MKSDSKKGVGEKRSEARETVIRLNSGTKKVRKYKHLDIKKRAQLELLLRQKQSKSEIARMLGIACSTVYEEIKRGMVLQLDSEYREYYRYYADSGQRVYEEHRAASRNPLKVNKVTEFLKYAEEQILKSKLSPDAICGDARRRKLFPAMVCTKTPYNYINQSLLRVKNIDLPLRVKRKNRAIRQTVQNRRYGDSIENRPSLVDGREEFGHWEVDTVVGPKGTSDVLLTLDERKTRMRFIVKIPSRTASAVREGVQRIIQQLGSCAAQIFRSVTSDNGSEFASLALAFLETTRIYYAHPYSAYERGTNENQNGIIRRFIPKGRSFADISDDAVAFLQSWTNNLPRRILGYHSAAFLFAQELLYFCPT